MVASSLTSISSSLSGSSFSGSPLSGSPELVRRQFTPRSALPDRSGSLWKIETGVVRSLTSLEDGTVSTLGICGPGDLVGNALSKIDPYQTECLTKVDAILLSTDLWQKDTTALLSYIQQIEELMVIRSYRKVDVMVVKLLTWLAKRFGKSVEAGQLIDLRLTHQDIAEILGTTRVTITRILSQLEQQGIIHRLPVHRIVLKEDEIWHYEI